MTTSEQLQEEIEKLRWENQVIKEIATRVGFFNFYFKELKSEKFKTNVACFDYVNELYFIFFGIYRYSDYNAFRKQYKSILKK